MNPTLIHVEFTGAQRTHNLKLFLHKVTTKLETDYTTVFFFLKQIYKSKVVCWKIFPL